LNAALAGRYRVERELGRGGMAVVLLAEDLKHHRKVAVKVLRPELTAGLGAERFLREIDVAAHMQHPHILPLFDSGELEAGSGVMYYVMPFVDSESLRTRLDREQHLPVDEAIRLTMEVADALSAAHAHGVIHRDIKPENILLVAGHAVVADFGIAGAMTADGGERLTATGVALGTPQYMSPEQATSTPVDGRADIYSLACVAYEMLSGAPPFTGSSAQAVLARHSVDAVASVRTVRPSVPTSVEKVLLRALSKVPADRYATAAEFAAALAKAITASEMARSPRYSRRWVPLAALGVALIALPVLWLIGERGDPRGNASGSSAPLQRRLAVLSFANLSADTADAYLARGISEEIASRLGDFPDLKIASRTAVDRIERADTPDVIASAKRLGFGYLVEGSVRRASEGVRVVVRLVDVADGVRRWNHTYNRAPTDLLELQDEIALDVAQAVVGQLTPNAIPARSRGPSPAAHDQLLRGNYYMALRNPRGLARAVEAFTRATELDPKFALAFANLAHTHVLLLDWGWTYDGLPPESLLTRGWKASERAIELGPQLADGWLARGGLLRFRDPVRLAGVREALQRAIDLSPENAEAHHEFGMSLRLLGDDSAAAVRFRQALTIEPDRPMSLVHLGWIDMIGRRYADAKRWLDSAAAVNPGFYQAYVERAVLRLVMQDTAGARADAQTGVRLRPSSDPLAAEDVLIALNLLSGDTSQVRSTLARFRKLAPGHDEPGVHQVTAWASLLAAAGQREEAIAFLERVQVPPTHLLIHLKEPRFDALRGDPRFEQQIARLRPREARGPDSGGKARRRATPSQV
ncbi:MAG: protein kinase domain-containing protein, partial [Gemmatimonadaceae bacterium]